MMLMQVYLVQEYVYQVNFKSFDDFNIGVMYYCCLWVVEKGYVVCGVEYQLIVNFVVSGGYQGFSDVVGYVVGLLDIKDYFYVVMGQLNIVDQGLYYVVRFCQQLQLVVFYVVNVLMLFVQFEQGFGYWVVIFCEDMFVGFEVV